MKPTVMILDYGMGNLHSVKKKLEHIGVSTIISDNRKDIIKADKLILPGVGHFAMAMKNINSLDVIDTLLDFVFVSKKPILGVCLGMQIMSGFSEEGNAKGLNWIDAQVLLFKITDKLKFKIPHIGWNTLLKSKDSPLLNGIHEKDEFYFVHSYHVIPNDNNDILTETDYEYRFCSAFQKENIFGVQFHPEKSHTAGELLLRNFVNL
ncbi:MAG: imidazole glycerol phosphate synthase subunit HisH [Bacteroidetes bacterium HGW-Bacteroidetes-21]|jgi:glutamine amidotransferase|nr:MAG: imidazole glycerol phosphate synthase subunit HisH [Bacteroidetes bacterium HGW-Bacteroidetes-21]